MHLNSRNLRRIRVYKTDHHPFSAARSLRYGMDLSFQFDRFFTLFDLNGEMYGRAGGECSSGFDSKSGEIHFCDQQEVILATLQIGKFNSWIQCTP